MGIPTKAPLSPTDDSLILLQAENEWEGAEHLAMWLSANKEENNRVAIICGMDTSILDQALTRHNLPRLGRSAPSRLREVQQILPLLLANAWLPVDVARLVELLALSIPPFPKWACRILLRAITQEPGVCGNAWNAALTEIQEQKKSELIEKGITDADASEQAKAFAKEIQFLLVENRFDPKTGIPEDSLKKLCQKVIELLGWQIGMDSRLASVIGHARELQTLATGKGEIPRTTLERMLDTVIGVGSISEDSLEEAGFWHVVDHPGQLVDPWETVLWWGFNDNTGGPATYWSAKEQEELKAAGIKLEATSTMRNREANAWQQGLLQAQSRFVAISLDQIDGEESYHHPTWDTIWCAATQVNGGSTEEEVAAAIRRHCKDVNLIHDWKFAGRKHAVEQVAKETPATTQPTRHVPGGLIPPPKKLSYSQMNTFIGCPMKWALEYHANLRLPESQDVPSGNKMIGTLCHRIVEELYAQTDHIDAATAVQTAENLYDSLLPSMAAELLLDGNAVERQRYRAAVAGAVEKLVSAINQRQLKVEKTEATLNATFNGIPFVGYADMILRDQEGHPYVLDLKWSSSDKYHRKYVEQGNALQLATYAWMLRAGVPSEVAVTGYFLLAQGKLISDSSELVDTPIPAPHSLERTWEMGEAAYAQTMEQLKNGLIEVRGVQEMLEAQEAGIGEDKIREQRLIQGRDAGILYQEPPCRFCDFGGICGKNGGAA
jgi:ATP-dependent helicase/nuclease subunit B